MKLKTIVTGTHGFPTLIRVGNVHAGNRPKQEALASRAEREGASS